MEGTNQVVPKLTAQGDMERTPPDPEDGELPEPVRPPSGPASIPFTPPHHVTDTRLVEEPELSRWTPGETPIEHGVVDWGMAMKFS